ncbi:MAG: 50S ribosomal protein L4 [Patescibacteria group bacterium]
MLKIEVLNTEGKKVGEENLEARIFGVKPDPALIAQAVLTHQANARKSLAHTKTRSEVRGGGRKPWKQKGTGRARQGSIRSPLWKGGGVTFGPRSNRNYSLKMNKKAKRKALFMCLSDKYNQKRIVVLEKLKLEKPKTKEFINIIKNLPLKNKFIIILPQTDFNIIRATNNIKVTRCLRADSLNIYDLLRFDQVLMPKESLSVINKTYLK